MAFRLVLGLVLGCAALGGLMIAGGLAYTGLYPPGVFETGRPNPGLTPAWVDVSHETVRVPTADGLTLSGWWMPSSRKDGSSRGVVVFVHGRSGGMARHLDAFETLVPHGYDVLAIDLRGYGTSDGRPSQAGFQHDVDGALAWLEEERNVPARQVILMGVDLGASVVMETGSRIAVEGLALIHAFTSIPHVLRVDGAREDLSDDRLAPAGDMVRLIYWNAAFDGTEVIGAAKAPVLFFHSPANQVVPYGMGRVLYNQAPRPRRFVDLNGGHGQAFTASGEIILNALDGLTLGIY